MIKLYCKIIAFCFALAIDFRGLAPRAPLYWNACGRTDVRLHQSCFKIGGYGGWSQGDVCKKMKATSSRRSPHRYLYVLKYNVGLSREMDCPSVATSIKEVERVTTLKHEICHLIWLQFDDIA